MQLMTEDQLPPAEIIAKGLTAPRVTPADIEANIIHTEIVKHVTPSGQVLRWAVLTTKNGYAATGSPSCAVSSENDDEEIGKEYAIINAKETLWPLMGYALKQRLHDANQKESSPTNDKVEPVPAIKSAVKRLADDLAAEAKS